MTETPAQPPTEELVRAAHVQKFVSYNINPDGRAILVFEIEGGSKFAITLELTALKPFRTMVSDVISAADKRGHHTGMASIHQPRDITVGHSDTLRGVAMVVFNPGADDESIFGIPDGVALNVAAAIEQDVTSRMTEADRRKHLAGKAKVLMPGKPRIILPGLGG